MTKNKKREKTMKPKITKQTENKDIECPCYIDPCNQCPYVACNSDCKNDDNTKINWMSLWKKTPFLSVCILVPVTTLIIILFLKSTGSIP